MQRRLAAILAADVVGFSRLMEADEEGTLGRLKGAFQEVVTPAIAEHNGRLVKTTGDGLLAEFASVVDAVRCAVVLQARQGERDPDLPADGRIQLRIGINLGDIMVEGGDIFGDGVNVAARLEGLAGTGEILLSGTAYDQVKKQTGLTFDFLGEQRVKNIAEPVRVYRVLTESGATGHVAAAKQQSGRPARLIAAAGLIAVAAGAALAWWRPWAPALEPASIERMALPLPDKPSIVVLPFVNMSGDPQQEYFADGITEDLTTDLSSLDGLFVIARNTAFTYKGKAVTPAQIAEELGVRYLVEGSVQRAGNTMRINAQLIDAVDGGHAWAKRFDGSLDEIFALQDQVTAEVLKAVAPRLTTGEQQALLQRETEVPEAYDAYLRGWEHYRRTTPEDFARAVSYFQQAIALDPNYWRAQAALALVYFRGYDFGWTASFGKSATEINSRVWEILQVLKDHPTSTSLQVSGNLQRERGWFDAALKEFEAARALNPNDPWTYAYMAYALVHAERFDEAEDAIDTAMRLDPNYPPIFVYYRGLVYLGQNRLEEAARSFQQAIELSPDNFWPSIFLVATYGLLDRQADAAAELSRADAARIRQGTLPFVFDEIQWSSNNRIVRPPLYVRFKAGLKLAGVPVNFEDARFASQRLGADEIAALFFGHRVHGRTYDSGQEHGAAVSADGVAIMSGDWGSGSGTAQLDGDQLCFVWTGGSTNCGWVYRNIGGNRANRNEFIWYHTNYGGFAFSQVE
jgi:TolB-like protein/class 3 adenylate cyclase/Flp pilus assembly protein TadD